MAFFIQYILYGRGRKPQQILDGLRPLMIFSWVKGAAQIVMGSPWPTKKKSLAGP